MTSRLCDKVHTVIDSTRFLEKNSPTTKGINAPLQKTQWNLSILKISFNLCEEGCVSLNEEYASLSYSNLLIPAVFKAAP